MTHNLLVLDPGFLTTVQDLGRVGYERFGVPVSGAMDRLALMAANLLVGNPPGAAGLEAALVGPALQAGAGCLVAAAGRGFALEVGGRALPLWMAAWVRAGESVALRAAGEGGWGYLAVSGGIGVPSVMGSRATYLRGSFGGLAGRALAAGDALPEGEPAEMPGELYARAGRELPSSLRPHYSDTPTLDVILGPQAALFGLATLETFLGSAYALTLACDRMGYRLSGPPAAPLPGTELLSEGISLGAVQVPGDGQPIVLMADRQTAGGYAKIAVVTSASLPLLAQCPPGRGVVRFRAVAVEEAQAQWRNLIRQLHEFH
jgi:biotin-dependent carboxylase-like uncharacterized protein